MGGLSRLLIAASLAASFGSVAVAQAQPHARRGYNAPERYDALFEGRSGYVDRPIASSGAVPPSISHTVMGLRVPR